MSGFQVGPETFVTLGFQVFDAEGEAASQPEVMGTVFGMGGLLPGVERAIEGKKQGDEIEIVLASKEAYGKRDPKGILEVDRSEFPKTVSVGDRFELENDAGGVLVVHVLDVQDEVVVIDTNHPLADQEVKFVVEIQEVRPATREEIEAQEALLDEDSQYLSAEVPDISPANLIRGRGRG